jgi:hypothetical protein
VVRRSESGTARLKPGRFHRRVAGGRMPTAEGGFGFAGLNFAPVLAACPRCASELRLGRRLFMAARRMQSITVCRSADRREALLRVWAAICGPESIRRRCAWETCVWSRRRPPGSFIRQTGSTVGFIRPARAESPRTCTPGCHRFSLCPSGAKRGLGPRESADSRIFCKSTLFPVTNTSGITFVPRAESGFSAVDAARFGPHARRMR